MTAKKLRGIAALVCGTLVIASLAEAAATASQTTIESISSPPVLVWNGGERAQPITLDVVHAGDPATLDLHVADSTTVLDLKTGRQTIEAYASPVKTKETVKVSIDQGGETLAAAVIDLSPVRNWEIHIVHQTHLDIGFTHKQEDVLKLQVEHLRTALRYIEETKDYPPEARFMWHPEGMWAVEEFMRTAAEEEKTAFLEACRKGRIHLDVLYAQAMTGMYNDEELFELMGSAKRFEKSYGVPIVSAMQSDVPGYTWGLASALAHHGVPYMSVGPNWFAIGRGDDYFKEANIVGKTHRGGRVFHWADKPFWWESPSGKHKILFWMPGWGYSGFHMDRGAISLEKVAAYVGFLGSKGYPYDMVLWRYAIGADNGPPSRDLPDTVKAWNE